MRRLLSLVILLGLSYFAFSNVKSAKYLQLEKSIYSLKLEKSIIELQSIISANKHSNRTYYLLAKASFLKAICTQNKEGFAAFYKINKKSIEAIKRNKVTTNYYFYLEELFFFQGIIKAKDDNLFEAANQLFAALKYGKKSLKIDPNQKAAYKVVGLIEAGLANLPSTYKKIASTLGFDVNLERGIKNLTTFYNANDSAHPEWDNMKMECAYYLSLIYYHQNNDRKKAWDICKKNTKDYQTNPLSAFLRANIAMKCSKNDEVINTIQKLKINKESTPIAHLNYLLGLAKLQKLDLSSKLDLELFLKQTKSKDFIKSAYQKLAWIEVMNDNTAGYLKYCDFINSEGSKSIERDKQAYKEAEKRIAPNKKLLKTRLLFDGGYFLSAKSIIAPLREIDFKTEEEKVIYNYRKARVYHLLNEDKLATAFYLEVIKKGSHLTSYYASYAALYIASVYEKKSKLTKAKEYYIKATSFTSNKEYKKSIEMKAKSGLRRCKNG